MLEGNSQPILARDAGGQGVSSGPLLQGARSSHTREHRYIENADGDDGIHRARSEHGRDQDREQQGGKGKHEIVAAHDQLIGGSAFGVIGVFLGVRVVHDTVVQLMDTMPDPEAMDRIRRAGLTVPGVLGIEKCFARKTGLKWHVDLHLEVDPSMTVYESHEIATQVKEKIRSEVAWVADVLVHVEPHMLGTIAIGTHGKP